MSNGMFAVDGIDLPGLVAEHLGPRVLPCVLYKPTGTPERDPDDPTSVPEPGAPVAHGCRGWIEDFNPVVVDGTRIKAGDRKVILLGATIEGSVEPEGGVGKDQVLVEGKRWNVHRVLSRDPAAATFTLQVRDV